MISTTIETLPNDRQSIKNIEILRKNLIEIRLKITKNLNRNLDKIFLLRGKATLTLSNEPSHDYVGLTDPELNAVPLGLRRVWFSAYLYAKNRKFLIIKM